MGFDIDLSLPFPFLNCTMLFQVCFLRGRFFGLNSQLHPGLHLYNKRVLTLDLINMPSYKPDNGVQLTS